MVSALRVMVKQGFCETFGTFTRPRYATRIASAANPVALHVPPYTNRSLGTAPHALIHSRIVFVIALDSSPQYIPYCRLLMGGGRTQSTPYHNPY